MDLLQSPQGSIVDLPRIPCARSGLLHGLVQDCLGTLLGSLRTPFGFDTDFLEALLDYPKIIQDTHMEFLSIPYQLPEVLKDSLLIC